MRDYTHHMEMYNSSTSGTEYTNLSTTVQKLVENSRVFYRNNRWRILSILLSGSLTWKTSGICSDADISVVTRFHYDIFLGKKMCQFLQRRIPRIRIEVGVYPLSRLTSGLDRSHYLYDLKYNSVVLAGNDPRHRIPKIDVNDLYPFEAFLMILNRSIDLIRSIANFTSEEIAVNNKMLKTAIARIQRAYVDSLLIFEKTYHPNYAQRMQIFNSLYGSLPKTETFADARALILESLNQGLRKSRIRSYESLFNQLESRYLYPADFRLYAFVKTKEPSALFHNPIYDVYRKVVRFFRLGQLEDKKWTDFRTSVLRVFDNSPKPCLTRLE